VGHMAFCTSCGATVQGAFCPQCGTPSSAASASAAPPLAQAPPVAMPPNAVAPVKRKTSVLVWILLALAGIFVLGVVGIGITAYYFTRNPGAALAKLITAGNPNVEVLDTDMGSQTMRIRDRKTGEEITISFDDIKHGRFKFSARDDKGQVANMEIGGGAGKMPAWVPTYPGATAQGNITAKGQDSDGMGEGGVVTFTTSDSPAQVTSFYQDKFKALGMTVNVSGITDSGGVITGADEDGRRSLNVLVAGGSGDTTITVTFGRKR